MKASTFSEHRRRLLRLVAIGLPPVILGALAWGHRWVSDDGFIYLHVDDNLVKGLGPIFNLGERVEAYTSPLWVALLALGGLATKPFVGPARPPFEWISVALGMACSIGGLALAGLAADRLQNPRTPESEGAAADPAPARRSSWLPVPFGTLVVLAIIPFWDYTTSGLETSLVFLWLALVFWGCVRLADAPRGGGQLWTAFAVGLGVLVRPDLGIFCAVFAALILAFAQGWRRRLAMLACMVALPTAYQLFRMGYFACLVPNTALAKEAGLAYWSHGWIYFEEFNVTYQLWIPLLLLTAAEVLLYRHFRGSGERYRALLVGSAWLAAIAHGLYVTRVGGDFLHARMLLPAVFALMLPVATVPLVPFRWLSLSMLTWAMLCFSLAQIPLDKDGPGIERGRLNFILLSTNPYPVTLDDYRGMGWSKEVDKVLDQIEASRSDPHLAQARFYSRTAKRPPWPAELQQWVQGEAVAYRGAVGIFAYKASDRIFICDYHGLADPYASRLELSHVDGRGVWHSGRGKPGHEKHMRNDWCVARTVVTVEGKIPGAAARTAHEALGCGDLGELTAAIHGPMSWSRFWSNVWLAPKLTWIRIPQDIQEARDRFCPPGTRAAPPSLHLRALPPLAPALSPAPAPTHGPSSVAPEEPADSDGQTSGSGTP